MEVACTCKSEQIFTPRSLCSMDFHKSNDTSPKLVPTEIYSFLHMQPPSCDHTSLSFCLLLHPLVQRQPLSEAADSQRLYWKSVILISSAFCFSTRANKLEKEALNFYSY